MAKGKNKLARFAENETFECLVQPQFEEIFHKDHQLKGNWGSKFFGNNKINARKNIFMFNITF